MPITISGSTGIAGVDGSASTPAVQGTDTNTGIAFPAADTVAVATGGTEQMRVDSSGNVGIGTSSPTQKLDVTNGRIALTEVYDVRWISSGGTLRGSISADSGSNLYFGTGSSNTERMRIDSNGNVQINTTNAAATGATCRFTIQDGSTYLPFGINNNAAGTGASNVALFARNGTTTGTISVTGTTTAYNTSSDYRLKENVVPLTGAAARVQALKPSRFNFIAEPGRTVDGFIAHEAAEVVPEAVHGEKDAVDAEGRIQPQGIDHSKLVPLLTAALQEALIKITALEARLTALEAK